MNLENARHQLRSCRERMNALYGQIVFDEWAVVSLSAGPGAVLDYTGPRIENFKRRFVGDVRPLREEMERTRMAIGDFAFAAEATGTHFDACVRLGDACYLFCNHTSKSMADIRRDPLWLSAQKAFVEMTEKFRADPLAD